jgi:D-xylulose reductase
MCLTEYIVLMIFPALSRFYACDADLAVKIPNNISWEVAGCIQPLAVAVQV